MLRLARETSTRASALLGAGLLVVLLLNGLPKHRVLVGFGAKSRHALLTVHRYKDASPLRSQQSLPVVPIGKNNSGSVFRQSASSRHSSSAVDRTSRCPVVVTLTPQGWRVGCWVYLQNLVTCTPRRDFYAQEKVERVLITWQESQADISSRVAIPPSLKVTGAFDCPITITDLRGHRLITLES